MDRRAEALEELDFREAAEDSDLRRVLHRLEELALVEKALEIEVVVVDDARAWNHQILKEVRVAELMPLALLLRTALMFLCGLLIGPRRDTIGQRDWRSRVGNVGALLRTRGRARCKVLEHRVAMRNERSYFLRQGPSERHMEVGRMFQPCDPLAQCSLTLKTRGYVNAKLRRLGCDTRRLGSYLRDACVRRRRNNCQLINATSHVLDCVLDVVDVIVGHVSVVGDLPA